MNTVYIFLSPSFFHHLHLRNFFLEPKQSNTIRKQSNYIVKVLDQAAILRVARKVLINTK